MKSMSDKVQKRALEEQEMSIAKGRLAIKEVEMKIKEAEMKIKEKELKIKDTELNCKLRSMGLLYGQMSEQDEDKSPVVKISMKMSM